MRALELGAVLFFLAVALYIMRYGFRIWVTRGDPTFTWSTLMTANQLGLNPLSGWQYEYVPRPSKVSILVRSTTAGTRITVYSGSETIQERTPIQAGGTIGVTPSPLNTVPIQFYAGAGDRLKLAIDEVLGGTPTVDGLIAIDPIA